MSVAEGNRIVGGYSLKARGKDPTKDKVISGIDHHLILILAEVLNRVTMTGVIVEGQSRELLKKFIFQYVFGEGRIGCICGDGSESVVTRHSCFFDSL